MPTPAGHENPRLPLEVPVLIVGAGPSGLMAALLLERLGIEALVVERRAGPQRAPAAHVVNARTLEICRAAGVDPMKVAEASMAPADAGFVDWVTKLGGERIGRLPFERQGDDQLEFTPTPLRNLSQNKFEPLLLDTLGTAPRWQCQWESAEQDEEVIRARLRDLRTDEVSEVRCRYLLAADGAGSRIRKSLEIPVAGPDRLQNFVMIHFLAALRDRLGSPPSVLNFVCDPVDGGAIVVHDLDHESTFMVPYDADRESLEDYDEQRCAEMLRRALRDPDLDFEIASRSTWAMTAQVADRYREGRVFLVGDSAHRFPPTGGLGLNTGVQDAHNLTWKLAFVLKGLAAPSLLDSYEAERRPVAQNNADQSLKNALRLIEVPQALGTTDSTNDSRLRMQETLADPAGRERVAAAIANQAEHFDMPGLQLGFTYALGSAGARPTSDSSSDGKIGKEAVPDAPRCFQPSGAPGRRLPHAWVDDAGARRSLLDWVPLDRFLLLVAPEGGPWLGTAESLGASWLVVRQISVEEMPDVADWLDIAGIQASGALLIRPDQHVAWRAETQSRREELGAALALALPRPAGSDRARAPTLRRP